MRSQRTHLIVAGIVLLAVGAAAAVVYAQVAPRPAPVHPSDPFTGQALLLQLKSGDFLHLHRPQVKSLGGRSYLVGKVEIFDGSKPAVFTGCTVWVPVEDVSRIAEFANLERLAEHYRKSFK